MGSAAKRCPDAEIADIENQHRPHGFARLPALGDKRSNALDAADGPIVVEGHWRVFRCGPYAVRFECTSLVCRIVKVGTFFVPPTDSCTATELVRGASRGSVGSSSF